MAIILLINACIVSTEAASQSEIDIETCTIVENFMEMYSLSLVNQNMVLCEDLLEDNSDNEFFYDFMEWRFAIMKYMNAGYKTHSYEIVEMENLTQSLQETSINVMVNEDFVYEDGGTGYCFGTGINIIIGKEDNRNIIKKITFLNDDFFEAYTRKINELSNVQKSKSAIQDVEKNTLLVDELTELSKEMELVYENQTGRGDASEVNSCVTTSASTYYYSGYRGAQYAREYGANKNPYFYYAANNEDCTNFVSQCIWAGYGGWTSYMTEEEIKSNIKAKVRMVPNVWHGGEGGGMLNWENVVCLWNYATSNTDNGPRATGYNNGEWYTGVLPIDITQGDVLQFSSDGDSYGHSVYVISTPGGSDPTYDLIYIAQHSYNTSSRKLTEVISIYSYMRHMQFKASTFES